VSKGSSRARRRVTSVAGVGLLAAAVTTLTVTAQAPAAHQATAGSTLTTSVKTSTKTSAPTTFKSGNYVVLMAGKPAAVYRGGVTGYAATAARNGTYNSSTRAAAAYTSYLKGRQQSLASSVGAKAYYNYTTSLNGFAAPLSGSQAESLSKTRGVIAVVPDSVQHADLIPTLDFLGLTGPVGLWRRLGGDNPASGAGKGVVVGIIDSGINDELEADGSSFASTGTPPPASWNGTCDTGEDDSFACNDKVIGGRYFDAAAVASGDVNAGEFISPDDFHGHGTHVASTAAGEYGVDSVINGIDFGPIGGMAPAAKLAAYKVCWEKVDGSNCSAFESDSAAAIDAAVADGVDVLNYSISGTADNPIDPVELAFMYAADAGVFIAASAGNAGPDASTVAHPSPWLTTVAAATYWISESTVELGDGTRMIGSSISPTGVDESPLVYAGDIPATGESAADAALCFPDSIDPTAAAGAIVICDRGVNARVEKGTVVSDAGGVGMILVNTSPLGTVADVQDVPTVHLESNNRTALLAYAETTDPTATILAGDNTGTTTPQPPAIAGFSSRGPSLAAAGDLLKPDITAPGVDVDAATAPEGGIGLGNDFAIISGTSMASPHIAGLGALILQKHPDWSPMEVKSAMMTTAKDLTDTADPFDQGAGFVRPNEFLDPGLVYDSGYGDWVDYLAGQGVTVGGDPISDTPIKASNLNVASIAVNDLAGSETVTRSVTNVGTKTSTYKASVTGLTGVTARVTPSTLTLAPDETGTFKVKLTRTSAAFGEYAEGNLWWKDGSHVVRTPVVVSPTQLAAPREVSIAGRSASITTKAGFNGTLGHHVHGLVANVDTAAFAENSGEAGNPTGPANYYQKVRVHGPSEVLRGETLPEENGDDLDLFLLDNSGAVVAASATSAGDETVTVTGLPRGKYWFSVEAFDLAGNRASTDFTLRTWAVGRTDAGNLKVTPATVKATVGGSYVWTATTKGLDPDLSYLGAVRWTQVRNGKATPVGLTVVSVG
jgi:subtilisin family serine protease